MRRMVGTGQDVFRVVVVRRVQKKNPDYVQGEDAPCWIWLDETYETEYGPYNSLGTAKGILTRETVDTWNDGTLKWGVVSGRVEKATTTWEKVDLSG